MRNVHFTALIASSVFAVASHAIADDGEAASMHSWTDNFTSHEQVLSDQQIDTITAGSHQYASFRIVVRYVDANGKKQRFVYRFKDHAKHAPKKGTSKNVQKIVIGNKTIVNNGSHATVRQVNSSNITVVQRSDSGK